MHDVAPMAEIRSDIKRVRGVRASGKVDLHRIFSDRNRHGSRQKTVTAELKSGGMMYRQDFVPKTG